MTSVPPSPHVLTRRGARVTALAAVAASVALGATLVLAPAALADPTSGFAVTATVPTGPGAYGVSVADGRAYVTNYAADSVSVIDTATDEVTATIPVGTTPYGIAADAATGLVYVANQGDGTVSVIDSTDDTVLGAVSVGHRPVGVAVDDGNAYVTDATDGTVSVIQEATNSVTAVVPVGASPLGVTVDHTTHTVYVANQADGTVSEMDGTTNTVTATLPAGSFPTEVAVDPATGLVYATNIADNAVSVIDPGTAAVTDTLDVGGSPYGIALDTVTGVLYTANYGDASLTAIDTATNSVLDTVAVGANPAEIAVDSETDAAYVTNAGSGSVSVVTPPTAAAASITGTPADGVVGQAYSDAFTVSGFPAASLAVTAGALPDGLTLSADGTLAGNPTAIGAFTYTVTASNRVGHTSVQVTTTIRATTTTALTKDVDAPVNGQAVTFTATVTPSQPGTPSGTVAFRLPGGSSLVGCDAVPVTTTGDAQCTVAAGFTPGSRSVTAVYSGDGSYTSSSSSTLTFPIAQAAVDVAVTASANPPVSGQQTTYTAVVSAVSPGTGTPSGDVTFTVTGPNGTVACSGSNTVALDNGSASCTMPERALSGGLTYDVSVSYGGEDRFVAGNGSLAQTVARARTRVAITAPAVKTGAPVTLQAAVTTVAPGVNRPTGTVTFTVVSAGGVHLACAGGDTVAYTVTSTNAQCAIAAGQVRASDGPYTVTAVYSGSRRVYASTTARPLTVRQGASKLVLTQPRPSTAAGRAVTFTAQVTPTTTAPAPLGGTVTFTVTDGVGATVACSGGGALSDAGGQSCTVAGPDLTALDSPYTVTATWSGDDDYAGSTATVTHTVTPRGGIG